MICADTSVWIHFLSKGNSTMEAALKQGMIVMHPWILGELKLGAGLSNKTERDLHLLPLIPVISHEELYYFIQNRRVQSSGVGWVDAQVLASALNSSVRLWTLDKKLVALAKKLQIAFLLPP